MLTQRDRRGRGEDDAGWLVAICCLLSGAIGVTGAWYAVKGIVWVVMVLIGRR